jgi:hypothetical protein
MYYGRTEKLLRATCGVKKEAKEKIINKKSPISMD